MSFSIHLSRSTLRAIWRAAWWRKAIFFAGAVLCAAAISGRNGFLRFLLPVTVARLEILFLGLMVCGIATLPQRYFDALEDVVRRCVTRADAREGRRFLPIFVPHLLLSAVLLTGMFAIVHRQLLGYIDGHYLLTIAANQELFAARGLTFSTNPLQGIGDVWHTLNTLWAPEVRIGGFCSSATCLRILLHWFAFEEIFIAVALLAYWASHSASRAVAGAWVATFLIAPLTFPSLVYSISPDTPNIATTIVFPFLVVVLWEGIGRGRIWIDFLRASAIVTLLWINFIAVSIVTVLSYPIIAVICLVFLFDCWRRRAEFLAKTAWSVGIVAALLASGFLQILLGLVSDTAFQFFPDELPNRFSRLLSDGSILLRTQEPYGVCVGVFALIVMLAYARHGTGRFQKFALASSIVTIMILAYSVLNVFVGVLGAIPIYYEFVMWPIYGIFAGAGLVGLWQLAIERGPQALSRIASALGGGKALALPVLGLVVMHGPNFARGTTNERPNVFPPVKTSLVEFLQGNIALTPGRPFRGRVATITGQMVSHPTRWEEMFPLDMKFIERVGNDHRTVGLWYYNIPTLTEFSQTIPPLIYRLTQRYLVRPGDIQWRPILYDRHADVPILRLLGVSYVLTDGSEPAPGLRRIRTLPVEGMGALALDEVPDPNLGVSPVEVLPLTMGRAALEWLGQNGDRFDRVALLAGSDPGTLVKATDITIGVEQGGLRVRARSAGRSLVVIPFQFSHCLRAVPRNGHPVELRRADLLLTGIIFAGELDAALEYRQGPFLATGCRLDDRADDRAFVNTP